MGDWNTLHLFDDKKFYEEIVPGFRGEGALLEKYFDVELRKYILEDNIHSKEARIEKIIHLCQGFDMTFKFDLAFYELCDKPVHPRIEYDEFIKNHFNELDDFNRLFTFILFSECALFNPHFRLGYRLLYKNLNYKNSDTVAEEGMETIRNTEFGSLLGVYGSGITNWLTKEEVEIVLSDFDNIEPKDEEDFTRIFISDLKSFLEIAVENNLGVISGVNMNEGILKLIDKPEFSNRINWENINLENVITHP